MPSTHGSSGDVPTASYESPPTRRRLVGLLVLVLLGAIAWWLVPRGDGSMSRVQAAGGLRIGYAVDPPYAVVTPTTGEVTGAAAETARLIAEQMGIGRIDWVQSDRHELESGLRAHRFDVAAAGTWVASEPNASIRLSDPILRVQPGWLVMRGNPKDLPPYAMLMHRADVRVAVLQGSAEHARLSRLGLPTSVLVVVPDAQAGQAAVLAGSVNGLASSLPEVRRLAAEAPERLEAVAAVNVAMSVDTANQVAFGFHPRDAELQAAWNAAQAQVIGTPRHQATLGSFGFNADDLPTTARPH